MDIPPISESKRQPYKTERTQECNTRVAREGGVGIQLKQIPQSR